MGIPRGLIMTPRVSSWTPRHMKTFRSLKSTTRVKFALQRPKIYLQKPKQD